MRGAAATHPLVAHPREETPMGRVGPNAVIQLIHALEGAGKPHEVTRQIFEMAGCRELAVELPAEMIDERIPFRLFQAVWQVLPAAEAGLIARDAGRRTADYILANRIPSLAKLVLKLLPARLSAALLLKAVSRNAWTFAGSGRFGYELGRTARLEIASNPLVMPGCAWHVGVFERLFGALVSVRTSVRCLEIEPGSSRDSHFEIAF